MAISTSFPFLQSELGGDQRKPGFSSVVAVKDDRDLPGGIVLHATTRDREVLIIGLGVQLHRRLGPAVAVRVVAVTEPRFQVSFSRRNKKRNDILAVVPP